jgi:predicted SAM-dependent methyltransferase
MDPLLPELLAPYLWRPNRLPARLPDVPWLHLGCGENVLEDFVNLDFLPHDARVFEWDFLQPWPDAWPRRVRGALSEDTLEHFFLAEQLYILCEVNRLLDAGGVFRCLMPALDRLIAYCRDFQPRPGEFLYETFAVETEADAINVGMRFSGHRWLHDDRSLAHLAAQAGFESVKTSCAQSSEPFLSGRNIRTEEGTAAFAHDLVKRRAITRHVVTEFAHDGFERVDALGRGIELLRAVSDDASLRFRLSEPVPVEAIACLNVRSATLGEAREHSLKRIELGGDFGAGRWSLDETMKSHATMNVLTSAAIRVAGARKGHLAEVALFPGRKGDRVTSGALELFVLG